MLKELLVLAAIGALCAPLAIKTQDANAQLYGSLHSLGVIRADGEASSIRGYVSRPQILAPGHSGGR